MRHTALALLFAAACTDKAAGTRLATGVALELTVSPAGAVAFLLNPAHADDRTVPSDLLQGELWLAAPGEAQARRVAGGVPTSPGAFGFDPSGTRLAALGDFRFRAGLGELVLAAGGAAHAVAHDVSAFSFARDGALAYVTPGSAGVTRADGARSNVAVEAAQAIAWSPDGKRLAVREASGAGGRLWVIDVERGFQKRECAASSSDFSFAPDGALAVLGMPPPKGGDRALTLSAACASPHPAGRATSFAFSPDRNQLALLSTGTQPGDAAGDLFREARDGGAPEKLGSHVSEYRYDDAGALYFLQNYDLRARAGTLAVARPGQPPRTIAQKVQAFVAAHGRVLYLVQSPRKGDFRIELWMAEPGGEPRKIDDGVYGWELSPDGALVYYRAHCVGARSCSLLRAPVAGGAAAILSPNVAGFELSRDGSRVLVQQPHRGPTRAVDLAVLDARAAPPAQVKPSIEEVDPSSRFVDAAGRRVVYATTAQGRAGVYLADVAP